MTKRQGKIFGEIAERRQAQDRQWGGYGHDYFHSTQDFLRFARKQLARAWKGLNVRESLLNAAAVLVAAIEILDLRREDDDFIEGIIRQELEAIQFYPGRAAIEGRASTVFGSRESFYQEQIEQQQQLAAGSQRL